MFKKLKYGLSVSSGRNNLGRITSYHRGGGCKNNFRIINFKEYNSKHLKGIIVSIEYDPNRTSYISLVCFENGVFTYVLTPSKIKIGVNLYCWNILIVLFRNAIANLFPLSSIEIAFIFSPGGSSLRMWS